MRVRSWDRAYEIRMQRHDEDYKQVISKLNGAFEQNKQDQAVNPGIFDKMDSDRKVSG